MWGLCTFAPGTWSNYDPSTILPGKDKTSSTIILRVLCILPIIAFIVYFL